MVRFKAVIVPSGVGSAMPIPLMLSKLFKGSNTSRILLRRIWGLLVS